MKSSFTVPTRILKLTAMSLLLGASSPSCTGDRPSFPNTFENDGSDAATAGDSTAPTDEQSEAQDTEASSTVLASTTDDAATPQPKNTTADTSSERDAGMLPSPPTDGGAMAECISNECSIGGVCYAHNQPNPENPCQYCDVTLAQSSWTNAPSTARCDDGLWCTGSEHCSGTGSCVHEFPDGDRCSDVVGACAASACDEQARSCFLAAGTECERAEEQRCVSPAQL